MNNKRYTVTASCMIVLYAVLQVLLGTSGNAVLNRFLPIVMVLLIVGFVVLHGYMRYGIKHLLVFFLITFLISWGYENISVVTGFPFGNYHYTDKLGFKLLYVPLIIMPAYVSTGYLAWMIA
ncbi:MAG: carotenoid biosynthesis protein, partial [bacterium]|nr:carotenoid biosynthesis protein [bacterium]